MNVENQIDMVERTFGDELIQSISARDLHSFLASRADFTTWMKKQINRARLKEKRDYLLHSFVEQLPSGAKSKMDYFLSIDAAKHIAMMSGSDRGFEFRDYFLECERQLNKTSSSALAALQDPVALRILLLGYTDRVGALEAENTSLRTKADFHDAVQDATNCQTVQEVAKVLGTGPNLLFGFLRSNRILTRDNLPHQQHVKAGRFKVIAGSFVDRRGDRQTYMRTLVTGRGFTYIQDRLADNMRSIPP